jgi:hypothetical protein
MTDAPTGWQPIETAPRNRVVLVAYKNCAGKWRRVRASYYDKGQLPGWYEECETAEYIQPTDEPPMLWHPLPKLPEETKT